MARKKSNKRQEFQESLNEIDDLKADKMRDLLQLNYQVKAKFKNQKQKLLANTIKENRITFVSGAPGSGKTFIALKTGLELLKKGEMGDMLLTTPVIEVTPKSIGALPGDIDEKIGQYFQHFWDNIDKLVDKDVSKFLKGSQLVVSKIINFMRGATFGKFDEDGNPVGTFCILDECQNLTIHELKMYLSRMGEGSKIIALGDPEQCDLKLKHNEKNALVDAKDRFQDIDGIGFVEFTEDDIVRDPFLIEIMKRYKND